MKKILLVTLFLFVMQAVSFNAQAVCLDYWLKGPSGCKEVKNNKKKIIINGNIKVGDVEKDAERIQYEADLNKKIDKFLASYGKPPREFVAFHLDPTLENAVKWVKKFNEDVERTTKIAVAWKQADEIFTKYKKTGQLMLPQESGVTEKQLKYLREVLDDENVSKLPDVKGFGVDIEGDWDESRLGQDYSELTFKEKKLGGAVSRLSNMGSKSSFSLDSLKKQIKDKKDLKESKKQNKKDLAKKFPIEINYYFSKKCPFCVKYAKSIKEVTNKFGAKNLKVTCVDVTPGEKVPSNKGDLKCKWRPALDGEIRQFGIKKTPALIVKRPNSKSLELLENYHDAETLEKYFINGPAKVLKR